MTNKTIYLCLAHMSEAGLEQKYIQEAFATNWVVPLGPNVNAFEKELEEYIAAYPQPLPKGKGVYTADLAVYKLLKGFAEDNRKNPTEAEMVLWDALKGKGIGYKFRRQHIIEDFIVDFYCSENNLTIEIDGGYHNVPEQMKSDAERTARLKELGYTEIRFTNEQVLHDFDNTITQIQTICKSLPLGGDLEEAQSLPLGGDLGEAQSLPLGGETEGAFVAALGSGTAAVHLGLLGLGVGPGDEVICQSFTFCASVNPVVYLGAKPVFVDSEPGTYNMDPELMEMAIKDRISKTGKAPKAIVPVHLYGMPAQMDRIMEVANRYGIAVMEDAAEAMGSTFDGQLCGTFGQYGVWSFNGNKMITTSGGGALICPSEETKKDAIFYATQAKENYPYYQHEHLGYNYRLSNICAGIGRGQLTVLDDHITHHRHVHDLYVDALKGIEYIQVHSTPGARMNSNYWLTTILLDPAAHIVGMDSVFSPKTDGGQPNDNVEQLRVYLESKGIESRPLWKPMHMQPIYRNCPAYVNGVSKSIFQRGLCLPSGPCVSDDDVKYIVDCIREAIGD